MSNCITYLLKTNEKNSNKYYNQISTFANVVLDKLQSTCNKTINEFQDYIFKSHIEKLRSVNEYQLEILVIGVMWNTYVVQASTTPSLTKYLMITLSNARCKFKRLKRPIDYLKGRASTKYFLRSPIKTNKQNNQIKISHNIKSYTKLIEWLQASGDFKYTVKRLSIWKLFLKSNSTEYICSFIKEASQLAIWFEKAAKLELGIYTKNVDKFWEDNHKRYVLREDKVFCGRKEVEYHLNMVGAEILNRVFRNEFLNTKNKMVLLPACMRLKSEQNCRAQKVRNGYLCSSCSSECAVNILTKVGKESNFKVLIIPHESDAFSNGHTTWGEVGIVGIACILNLLEGGWKAQSLNFIPQCVILDFCGCKNHWHTSGIQTQINNEVLFKTLQIHTDA